MSTRSDYLLLLLGVLLVSVLSRVSCRRGQQGSSCGGLEGGREVEEATTTAFKLDNSNNNKSKLFQEHHHELGSLLEQYVDYMQQERNGGRPTPLDEDADSLVVSAYPGRRSRGHSGSLSRPKRRGSVACPREPATGRPSGMRAFMRYHRPGKRKDIRVNENKQGRWNSDEIDRLLSNGFDLTSPTLVYMGGWLQDSEHDWVIMLKERYKNMTENGLGVNMLIFDWSDYGQRWYDTSVSFVPHLGRVLAGFFDRLIDKHQYNVSQIHMISYSLSTHISGLAGRHLAEKTGQKMGQITAIDPTAICFHDNPGGRFDTEFGLRPTDANLVVSRHYNMQGFGAGRLIGGLDVLVNDGSSQPAMWPTVIRPMEVVSAVGGNLGSHLRAIQHEVIGFDLESGCQEVAYECSSYKAFLAGECGDWFNREQSSWFLINTFGNIALGLHPEVSGKYKLGTQMIITTGRFEYCVHHYQVVALMSRAAPQSSIEAFKEGHFYFDLDDGVQVNPKNRVAFGGRTAFTQMLRLGDRIQQFKDEIQLKASQVEALDGLENLAVNFLSHVSPKVRADSSVWYCVDSRSRRKLIKCKQSFAANKGRNKSNKVARV